MGQANTQQFYRHLLLNYCFMSYKATPISLLPINHFVQTHLLMHQHFQVHFTPASTVMHAGVKERWTDITGTLLERVVRKEQGCVWWSLVVISQCGTAAVGAEREAPDQECSNSSPRTDIGPRGGHRKAEVCSGNGHQNNQRGGKHSYCYTRDQHPGNYCLCWAYI